MPTYPHSVCNRPSYTLCTTNASLEWKLQLQGCSFQSSFCHDSAEYGISILSKAARIKSDRNHAQFSKQEYASGYSILYGNSPLKQWLRNQSFYSFLWEFICAQASLYNERIIVWNTICTVWFGNPWFYSIPLSP